MNEGELEIFYKANEAGKDVKCVKVQCPKCKEDRLKRLDKYINCKTLLCKSCNARENLVVPSKVHGLSDKRVYRKYYNMLHRCYNDTNKSFKWYGGRGIGVCDEWLDPKEGLINFTKFAYENGFTEFSQLQIDRIDNDDDYSPCNVQFISQKENLKKMRKGLIKKSPTKKKNEYEYKDLIQGLALETVNFESDEAEVEEKKLVPLWDFLENIGKKIKK